MGRRVFFSIFDRSIGKFNFWETSHGMLMNLLPDETIHKTLAVRQADMSGTCLQASRNNGQGRLHGGQSSAKGPVGSMAHEQSLPVCGLCGSQQQQQAGRFHQLLSSPTFCPGTAQPVQPEDCPTQPTLLPDRQPRLFSVAVGPGAAWSQQASTGRVPARYVDRQRQYF